MVNEATLKFEPLMATPPPRLAVFPVTDALPDMVNVPLLATPPPS